MSPSWSSSSLLRSSNELGETVTVYALGAVMRRGLRGSQKMPSDVSTNLRRNSVGHECMRRCCLGSGLLSQGRSDGRHVLGLAGVVAVGTAVAVGVAVGRAVVVAAEVAAIGMLAMAAMSA